METVVVLPVLLVMFLAILDFGVRGQNTARTAMAVRYGAWLGAHDRYDDMEKDVMAAFFPFQSEGGEGSGSSDAWYNLAIQKSHESLRHIPGKGVIPDAIRVLSDILPDDMVGQNVKVIGTYSQKKLMYQPPQPWYQHDDKKEAGEGGDEDYYPFLGDVRNAPIEGYWCDVGNTWDSLDLLDLLHLHIP